MAYIGDGRLDLPAALTCDRIFAVADSSLADLARVAGRTVEEFELLDEVAASCSGAIRCYHAPHGKPHRDVLDLPG